MDIDAHVWQFGTDYTNALGGSDDTKLPLRSVMVKAFDERWWMANFDSHSAAISGPTQIARLVSIYKAQSMELLLWCVPKGRDVARQLALSKACLDVAGVEGLVFDVEPYSGFCAADCSYLAGTLMKQLRAARPNKWLGVTYDPRSQHWDSSGTRTWLQYANGALPMVYFDTFAGQGDWADPTKAVRKAHTDLRQSLAPGRSIEYFPILQGAASASRVKAGLVEAVRLGSTRVSVWRRGIVTAASWSAIASVPEPAPPPPPPPPPDECVKERELIVQLTASVRAVRASLLTCTADKTAAEGELSIAREEIVRLEEALDRARSDHAICQESLAKSDEFYAALQVLKRTLLEL